MIVQTQDSGSLGMDKKMEATMTGYITILVIL